MSTTWINSTTKANSTKNSHAAAWIEAVSDRLLRTGTAGCIIQPTNGPGRVEVTDAYATVKAALTSAFIEFDSLEITEANAPIGQRAGFYKASVNSALAQSVRPGPTGGLSVIVFASGHEVVVSGEVPTVAAALAAA